MAGSAPEVFLQSLGDPIADRALPDAGLPPHSTDQALGQFDSEDFFDFWNRQQGGLLLSRLYIARRLARRHAKPSCQTRDDFCRTLFLVQKMNGLIHAPVILGYGRPTQYDTRILPYTATSIIIHHFEPDQVSERTAFAEEAN